MSTLSGNFMEVTMHTQADEANLVNDAQDAPSPGIQAYLERGNTLTMDGATGQMSVSRVTTTGAQEAYSPIAPSGSILATAHYRNSSAPCNDMREMLSRKDQVVVQSKGVEMTLAAAISAGLIGVDGGGNLIERSVESLLTPEPMTREQMNDSLPISPFSKDGAHLYGLLADRLGSDNRAYQTMAQLLSVYTDPQYEDADAAFQAAGRKLSTVLPSLGQKGSAKVAKALFKGLTEGIGREVYKIDPNIDPDHFEEWFGDVRDDHQRSMLLGCLAGSRLAVKQLVEKYRLKNRS